MTEQEWVSSSDPAAMLRCNFDPPHIKFSARKLRLFAVACCEPIRKLMRDKRSTDALDVAERFADGQATEKELAAAWDAARAAARDAARAAARDAAWAAAWDSARDAAWDAARAAAREAARAAARNAAWAAAWAAAARDDAWDDTWDAARDDQAKLFRHLVGNPFRRPPVVPAGQTIRDLAESLYAGSDCTFALADALEEAAAAELAAHFREPGPHPKGCWAMDLILGKA